MIEELKDEWDELISLSTGKKYYFNKVTKKSQLEKPENYKDESFEILFFINIIMIFFINIIL
jgi:hypothetical protein